MRGAAAASAVHPRCPPAGFPPSPRPPIPLFRRAPKVTDRRGEGGTPRRGAAAVKVGSPMGGAHACVPLGSLAIWAHPRQPSSSAGAGAPVTQLRPATVSGSLSLRFAALSRCCSSTCQGRRGFMASQGRRVSFSTTVRPPSARRAAARRLPTLAVVAVFLPGIPATVPGLVDRPPPQTFQDTPWSRVKGASAPAL